VDETRTERMTLDGESRRARSGETCKKRRKVAGGKEGRRGLNQSEGRWQKSKAASEEMAMR